MSRILHIKILTVGVIFMDMSATWRYSYVSTTFGTGCRTGGSPSASRRNRYIRKSEKEIQKPRENKVVVRNTSVCWGVQRESGRKEGAQIWVRLPLCLMREVACLSETILCLIGSSLVLC